MKAETETEKADDTLNAADRRLKAETDWESRRRAHRAESRQKAETQTEKGDDVYTERKAS